MSWRILARSSGEMAGLNCRYPSLYCSSCRRRTSGDPQAIFQAVQAAVRRFCLSSSDFAHPDEPAPLSPRPSRTTCVWVPRRTHGDHPFLNSDTVYSSYYEFVELSRLQEPLLWSFSKVGHLLRYFAYSLSSHLLPLTQGGKPFRTDDRLHFLVIALLDRIHEDRRPDFDTSRSEHHHILLRRLEEVAALVEACVLGRRRIRESG